jgi:hypothetical protein
MWFSGTKENKEEKMKKKRGCNQSIGSSIILNTAVRGQCKDVE